MGHDVPTFTSAAHDHGPNPSFEWIIEGDERMVLPHLRTLAPKLSWEGRHFDIDVTDRAGEQLPPVFMIDVEAAAVGAVDFLPLPADRTLMRLFLCSDLGTNCQLDDGDRVAIGFAQAWLARLEQLGFMASTTPPMPERRRLGFPLPGIEVDAPREAPHA